MRTRAAYLEAEHHRLAPYAVRASESRGRRHAELEHELRSPFERDRDRIIHSSAFRKLEYKTQVFVNHEGDYYRTRLTHTLEVAQIARSVARFLHLNEDLTEAIALVHDVGHPPFGHAGEVALQRWMKDHGGFEHNLHALRVVDCLESRYPEFPGINLTWEVREGIAKHSRRFSHSNPPSPLTEFAGEPWPTLEAQIVDCCDGIAYNTHDLDDGLTAGMLALSDLNELELWREHVRLDEWSALTPEQIKYLGVRALINAQVLDLLNSVEARIAEYGITSPDDVRRASEAVGVMSGEMREQSLRFRRFLWKHVYGNYRVFRMSAHADRVLSGLFQCFDGEPRLMPPRAQDSDEAAPRAICDYLASLTDREALDEYRRLHDPAWPA